MNRDAAEAILEVPVPALSRRGEIKTIRDYLHGLLRNLWAQGEGFSSKRPYGNSGWEYDLYTALARAGLIEAELDEDGGLEDITDEERTKADRMIEDVIDHLCGM
jgi:hypothetical protein